MEGGAGAAGGQRQAGELPGMAHTLTAAHHHLRVVLCGAGERDGEA